MSKGEIRRIVICLQQSRPHLPFCSRALELLYQQCQLPCNRIWGKERDRQPFVYFSIIHALSSISEQNVYLNHLQSELLQSEPQPRVLPQTSSHINIHPPGKPAVLCCFVTPEAKRRCHAARAASAAATPAVPAATRAAPAEGAAGCRDEELKLGLGRMLRLVEKPTMNRRELCETWSSVDRLMQAK